MAQRLAGLVAHLDPDIRMDKRGGRLQGGMQGENGQNDLLVPKHEKANVRTAAQRMSCAGDDHGGTVVAAHGVEGNPDLGLHQTGGLRGATRGWRQPGAGQYPLTPRTQ